MKIVNLTVGKNPPLIRTNHHIWKAVCYQLVETNCDFTIDDVPEEYRTTKCPPETYNDNQSLIKYKIISDNPSYRKSIERVYYYPNLFGANLLPMYYKSRNDLKCITDISGETTAVDNLFKVIIPPLRKGFYRLIVKNSCSSNEVLISVL